LTLAVVVWVVALTLAVAVDGVAAVGVVSAAGEVGVVATRKETQASRVVLKAKRLHFDKLKSMLSS
jgi:hypothetical protein